MIMKRQCAIVSSAKLKHPVNLGEDTGDQNLCTTIACKSPQEPD